MRVRLISAAALTATACMVLSSSNSWADIPNRDATIATWSANCKFVANLQIDPVDHYGEATSPHLHSFSAATLPLTSTMTPLDLRNKPANDCNSPNAGGRIPDRSSYWSPSLRSTNITPVPNSVIDPITILTYYRNVGIDPNTMIAFDQDFSFRAGNPGAISPQLPEVISWSCVANRMGRSGPNEVNFGELIPLTCPKNRGGMDDNKYMLRLVVFFPDCVDPTQFTRLHGQWTPTNPSYATKIVNPLGQWTRECAQPGYKPIPQVQVGYRWPLSALDGLTTDPANPDNWDLSSLKLASDMTGQSRGVSAHMDFMSGWSDTNLANLMKYCFWSPTHLPIPGFGPANCGAIGGSGTYGTNEN